MKPTFKTKCVQHVSGTLISSKQVQFRYVKKNTPQNYQDWVSLCSQNHVLKLVADSDTKHMYWDKLECVYKKYLSQ